jgi:hypothetical protein
MRFLVACLLLSACVGKSKSAVVTGGLTTSAVATTEHDDFVVPRMTTSAGDREQLTGVELRGFMGGSFADPAIPNAYGFTMRQLGEGVTTSIQSGWMVALPAGAATLFGKVMFDLVSIKKVGEGDVADTTLSAFSPTVDVGIAPFGRGICTSISATWDVHFNQPDRAIIGVSAGLCGGRLKR